MVQPHRKIYVVGGCAYPLSYPPVGAALAAIHTCCINNITKINNRSHSQQAKPQWPPVPAEQSLPPQYAQTRHRGAKRNNSHRNDEYHGKTVATPLQVAAKNDVIRISAKSNSATQHYALLAYL